MTHLMDERASQGKEYDDLVKVVALGRMHFVREMLERDPSRVRMTIQFMSIILFLL